MSLDDDAVLDNVIWHSLTTEHAPVARGDGRARRILPDVSVFAAIEADDPDAWDDLAALVEPGGFVVLSMDLEHGLPDGWGRVGGGPAHQMIWAYRDAAPTIDEEVQTLTVEDVPKMLELVHVAQPGPFRERTIELGTYLGIFHGERLVAMAGERLRTSNHTEISAVCTHPDAQRRGYAAALTHRVASGIVARGQIPVLHVMESNVGARSVYERLGFTTRRVVSFHAVNRTTDEPRTRS